MTRIELARQTAHEAHDSVKHVRKYCGSPYWIHTDEVAETVSQVTNDEDVIIAAHHHDTLEDCLPLNPFYSVKWLINTFGKRAAGFVIDLTDVYTHDAYPKLNRAERKRLERERIGATCSESKTLKLADLISNTYSIVEHDKGFARTYIREKEALLPLLMDGETSLLVRAGLQVLDAKGKLDMSHQYIIAR